jgi:hypothetical protein
MKQLTCTALILVAGIFMANAQDPALPKTGAWGTFGESQFITVESKKNPSFVLELKTAPKKKVVMACHYTTAITNTSATEVSFVIQMISPSGPTSSDDSKVKLKAGETKEVNFLIGNCKGNGDDDKKFEACCACSFSFSFGKVSVD